MKYWVYMNGEVPGCYTPQELGALSGFSMTTLVCPAEGEILEKNWRRSGEFADIIKIVQERDAKQPPSTPSAAVEPPVADVNLMIDTASARLFSHVADLMKELENRREERALTHSVQRQLVDLKEQLTTARERSSMLETRLPRLNELEEAARKNEERVGALEAQVRAREDGLAELRIQLEKTRMELDNSKRRLGEALNDLGIRNRLVDKLSRDLTEKELSLAKALGVIRRLEEDLHRLMPAIEAAVSGGEAAEASAEPAPFAPPRVEQIPAADPPAEPKPADSEPPKPVLKDSPSLRSGVFTIASVPPPPLPLPAGEAPAPALSFLAPADPKPAPSLPEIPALAPLPGAPVAAAPKPAAAPSYTIDEPKLPTLPSVPPPADAPAAQNAIVDLFKRFISKDLHS